MNIILFDNEVREQLLPLTFTRPVAELRVGILTIKEKWEKWMGVEASYITRDYLAGKFPIDVSDDNIVVDASILPNEKICSLIRQLEFNDALLHDDELVATRLDKVQFGKLVADEEIEALEGYDIVETPYTKINHLWDIFRYNGQEIENDFDLLTNNRLSAPISTTNRVIGNGRIFIEEGAKLECATFNTKGGAVYIGAQAEVMEGALVRGPVAVCDHAILKLGAKIYGGTTIGPYCKVGGEVNNSVLWGRSSKAHDGYLGNAVVGEWCNFGAGSSNSNLKNNYSPVKVWNYPSHAFQSSGLQFCGLVMGDHSKCAINTSFNTGTVVGVSANIFGSGFPRKFIPSFAWGGSEGYQTYDIDKAFTTAERVMQRKQMDFDVEERIILMRVFEETSQYRK